MTLWGFVSDIHGNRRALDRVEWVAAERGIDRFACLGDVVGRGDADGCVAWVRDRAAVALAGNRDLDHLGWLSPALREVVRGWPRVALIGDLILTHGDPGGHPVLRSTMEREGFRRVAQFLAQQSARVWLFGHTHFARVWALKDGAAERIIEARLAVREDRLYVVNVGTAGLPLHGKGGASMVLFDDSAKWLEIATLENPRESGTFGSEVPAGRYTFGSFAEGDVRGDD